MITDPSELRDLIAAIPSGIAVLDASGRVVHANPALGALFGIEADDLGGQPLGRVLPALGEEVDWEKAARNAIERGRTLRLARHAVTDGRQVDCTLERVCLGPDRTCALLTVLDVSDVVRAEQRMLRQARSQAIANLGDSVAHEIRNPLNSIHMNVQLLREGLNRDPVDRARLDKTAATVLREIRRLDRVVRDFVQYSRPPALHLEAGSVNHVVRAALDLLDAQIQAKRLRVVIDLQSARPVPMDRDRLQRALYNILLNAVQVLPEGGEIVCRSRDEDRRCLIEVSDDGPGLDLAHSAHVFDVFYTTKPGGSGLGLPISNRIIEEHGGRIAVASEPGRGATFAVFLPYESPPAAGESGPTTVPVVPEGRPRT
jgi:two-component system sensor histidine kinase HydH